MTLLLDEVCSLNAEVRRLLREHKVGCAHDGCTEPVTHGRRWRTEGMPAAAFAYLCATHAAEQQQQGKKEVAP